MTSNTDAAQWKALAITDTKHYVPIVTISTQDKAMLLQQLKSVFNVKINSDNNQSKIKTQAKIRYLNKPFYIVWKWMGKNSTHKTLSSYYRNKKWQCYDWWTNLFFHHSVKNDLKICDNVQNLKIIEEMNTQQIVC